jgi:hypothetical protein
MKTDKKSNIPIRFLEKKYALYHVLKETKRGQSDSRRKNNTLLYQIHRGGNNLNRPDPCWFWYATTLGQSEGWLTFGFIQSHIGQKPSLVFKQILLCLKRLLGCLILLSSVLLFLPVSFQTRVWSNSNILFSASYGRKTAALTEPNIQNSSRLVRIIFTTKSDSQTFGKKKFPFFDQVWNQTFDNLM